MHRGIDWQGNIIQQFGRWIRGSLGSGPGDADEEKQTENSDASRFAGSDRPAKHRKTQQEIGHCHGQNEADKSPHAHGIKHKASHEQSGTESG